MGETKLILVEGLPGSGKSTLDMHKLRIDNSDFDISLHKSRLKEQIIFLENKQPYSLK
jgi:tRNA uridine 5-carbamoylmethylation protein Kti12